jgi:glycine/D-amino acid oxidase-like deaminating enzyme
MLSFWEKDAWTRYDAIVIGGGIIGLSTAISLKERHPQRSVVVLERGLFPSGASTRNAGFACFGSLTEILSDMKKNGVDATVRLVGQRWRGLQMLRARLGDDAIAFEQHGGYELLFEEQLPALDSLEPVNADLRSVFSGETFSLKNERSAEFGFNTDRVKALVYSPLEGQIHSGRMMQALMRLAQSMGILVLTGAEVHALHDTPTEMRVMVRHLGEDVSLYATECALCTNAFTSELLPQTGIKPARGQVLLTSPIPQLALRGTFHLDEGFYYFRNVQTPEGQRILLGGGRNLAFHEEETSALELNAHIHSKLDELLHTTIAPQQTLAVEHRWSGIMGFQENKLPEVRRVSEHCVIGFGCNGMGVALGSIIGAETAGMLFS